MVPNKGCYEFSSILFFEKFIGSDKANAIDDKGADVWRHGFHFEGYCASFRCLADLCRCWCLLGTQIISVRRAIKVMEEKMNVLKEQMNVLKAESNEKINVLKAENHALEEKTRAEVAVAENRTMNKLLMYGFVEE